MSFTFKIDTLNKKLTLFFLIFIGLAFGAGIYGYNGHTEWPPIKLDGEGYYSYLPATVIYKSFDFSSVEKSRFNEKFPDWTGIRPNKETGRLHNQYPMGVAILISPLFLVAHVIALFSKSFNADGYSLVYQISILAASCFYYLLGTYFLAKYLSKFFKESIVFLTIVFITFGTSLFHYTTLDSAYSHIYSYCFVSLLLYLTEKFWQEPTVKYSLILGGVIGVLFLIRNYNVLLASFFFLYPLGNGLKEKVRSNAKLLALVAGTVFITIFPQLIVWKVNAGSFFVYSYMDQKTEGASFNWLSPHIIDIFSSIKAGVFIWSPVLLMGLIGLLFCLRGSLKKVAGLSLLNIGVSTYIMASFWAWHFGEGYGHRGFVDLYPFFAIGVAAFFSQFERPIFLKSAIAIFWAFTLLSSLQMFNYWKDKIDVFKPTWDQYYRALTNSPRLILVELLPTSMKSLTANKGLFAKGAIIIPHDQKSKIRTNGSFLIKVMIKNAGYSFWLPQERNRSLYGTVALGGQWYPREFLESCERPTFPPIQEARIKLWDIVSPKEWVHFEEFIKAPSRPGTYYFMLGMISEEVSWFDKISRSFVKCIEVEVTSKSDKSQSPSSNPIMKFSH
jgi:hypothetical protein